jgi:hypothetical protein
MCLYEDGILPKAAIFDYLCISSWTFDHVLSLWNATGEVVRERNGVHGRPRDLNFSDVEYLKLLITQTGFSTSSSTCFRQTASYLHTLLRSIGSLFELESQTKRSRKLPLNIMRISEQTLSLAWCSTHMNNLGFSMRFRKTSALPLGLVGDLVKGHEQSEKVSLFAATASLPKACYR